MDRQVRRLAIGFLVLFAALAINLNYIQVIAAEDLYNNDANLRRRLIEEYDVRRGRIFASDRRLILAESEASSGEFRFLRTYPTPPELGYGHLTGFYSLVSGTTELEESYNDYLAARDESLLAQGLIDEILGREKQGASLVLTIDPELQELAASALSAQVGEAGGAVAAVDPQTGDVLALVSIPTYDPNPLSTHDSAQIREAYQALEPDSPTSPLISRATDTFFPPGSSFKIVTAAAALENGFSPQDTVANPPELDLPQTDENLENFGGAPCPGGSEIDLALSLQVSCNVAFAEWGLRLGADTLVEQARRFGFSEDIPFDIPFTEGEIPGPDAFADDLPALAQSAIGQRDVRTNVLHMALVAGSIGNGGVMMQPRLVREIRDPKGRVLQQLGPQEYGEPMAEENAAELTEMMVAVVEGGTGTAAQVPGVPVAGKTGTAQTVPGEAPHAWFVSFAPADDPTIAVAVMILNGGDFGDEITGGGSAAPIAKQLIEAWLNR